MIMKAKWSTLTATVIALASLVGPYVAFTPVCMAADADNSGKNVRDRGNATLTPMDQGNSESDRTISQEIRKAVVGNGDFPTAAKNVKIITVGGVVTLRGPVKSANERSSIGSIAKHTAGVKRVDNQLEVEAKP
jgi:hyperosmotically inducible protein